MIRSDATFDGTFPFAPHFDDASGFRMHYVDEGPRDGEIVLCLHGEPTWGYLFRHLVTALSPTYRVVVPDHMGFGKSATPQDRSYWLQDHIDNLERFVLAHDLDRITLVMHDFGGPVGMGLAARHPDRIRRIVSANGPTPFGQTDLAERLTANGRDAPWFQWIMRAAADGTLETVLGQLGFNILSTLKLNGFENHAIITDTWTPHTARRSRNRPTVSARSDGHGGSRPAHTGSRNPMRRRCARYAASPRSRSGETPTERSAPNTSCRSLPRCFRPRRSSGWRASGTTASRMRRMPLPRGSLISFERRAEKISAAGSKHRLPNRVRGRCRARVASRQHQRHRMTRVTPRPRGSAIASGVLPSILMTWMSPLKSCPFSV